MLVVLVVLVSQSIVNEFGDNVLSDTDCEIVEPQSFSSLGSVECSLLQVKEA